MHVTCFVKTLIVTNLNNLFLSIKKMHVACFLKTLIVILSNKIDKN